MKKYLTEFSTYDNYKNFLRSGQFVEPNVSNIIQTSQQDETRPLVMYSPIEFFVYHTSDCTVEKIVIPKGSTFDITSVVREGYFYAGYFSAYGGAVSYDTDNPHEGIIEGDYTYDGSSLTTPSKNRFFVRTNAYKQNGTEMHPNNNVTYFVKEIPKDYYVKIKTQYLYNTSDGKITQWYNIFNIDDNNFADTNCNIITSDSTQTINAHVGNGVSIDADNKITSETISGRRGYTATSVFLTDILPGENSVFILESEAITLDGIAIHRYIKVYTNDWTKDNITHEYSDTMPSLD